MAWTVPAIHAVGLEHTYSAYISPLDGSISLETDSLSVPGLLDSMLEEGKKQLTQPATPSVNN